MFIRKRRSSHLPLRKSLKVCLAAGWGIQCVTDLRDTCILNIVERIHPVQPSLPMADHVFAGGDLLLCGSLCSPSNHRWRLGNEYTCHLLVIDKWRGFCEPWSHFLTDAMGVYHVSAAAGQQRALRSFHGIFSIGLTRAGASGTAFQRWFQLLLCLLINELFYILTYSRLWVWNNTKWYCVAQNDTLCIRIAPYCPEGDKTSGLLLTLGSTHSISNMSFYHCKDLALFKPKPLPSLI